MARDIGFEPTTFSLGRSGASVGGGSMGLQAVENIGNRSESNSHSAPPEAPFSSDFVSGLCLGTRGPGSSAGASQGGPDRLLSVRQVADHLGVTTATVYGLCAHGRLAPVRILNVIRIAPNDLSEFIASGRRLGVPRRGLSASAAGNETARYLSASELADGFGGPCQGLHACRIRHRLSK
jgi:Helix-turn-helix domain